MSLIVDKRGNPITSAPSEPEFNPFTDDELAAMDPATRESALKAASAWWAAEQKRHRKMDKRLHDRAKQSAHKERK